MIWIIFGCIISTWCCKSLISLGIYYFHNFPIIFYLAQCNWPSMLPCCRYIAMLQSPNHVLFEDKIRILCILLLIDLDLAYKIWHKISIVAQSEISQLVDLVPSLDPANILCPMNSLGILVQNNQPLINLIVCRLVRIILFQVLWPERHRLSVKIQQKPTI